MNLNDLDFVNECIDFVNSFTPGTAKPLEINKLIDETTYNNYIKVIDMTVQLKKTAPDGAEVSAKAESAKKYLSRIRVSKRI